jgi:hypothetical protein
MVALATVRDHERDALLLRPQGTVTAHAGGHKASACARSMAVRTVDQMPIACALASVPASVRACANHDGRLTRLMARANGKTPLVQKLIMKGWDL